MDVNPAADAVYVMDTNAVLYFLAGHVAQPLPPGVYHVSVITEIELLSYPLLKPDHEAEICDFLADITIVDLSHEIKHRAIALRRQYKLKLPDAVIAATTSCLNAKLLTNDSKLLGIPLFTAESLPLHTPH